MKILLVEDSPTLRHAMSQYIIEAGHIPLIAESGEEALQKLEGTPVDMIIMDVEMPGLNGFETTVLIREWLGDHWIPIIFVTGKNSDEDYQEGIEAGGDDYLIKPVSKMIIKAKIRAMERISGMRDQLHKLNTKLEILSQKDSLTQILNRRTFTEQAQQQRKIAVRQHQNTSILMIDVDHFKLYNDCYGHPAGDKCLQQVTQAIATCLHRPSDLLGRYGGEEFIVFLAETDTAGTTKIAESINLAVEALSVPHQASTTSGVVTVSIGGVCSTQTKNTGLEELINAADRALYRAKHSGRNQFDVKTLDTHYTVLIAHANETILEQASACLQSDYNIITTDSIAEGLQLAARIRPDLLILSHSQTPEGKQTFPLTYAGIPVIHISDNETPVPSIPENLLNGHVVKTPEISLNLLNAVQLSLGRS